MTTSRTFSTARPMCFARGRNGDVYGVNGLERGVRFDIAANAKFDLGMPAPASKPTLAAKSTGTAKYYLSALDVVDGGFNYKKEPTITLTGNAAVKADLVNGSIGRVQVLDYGSGYTDPPTVTVDDPDATSPAGANATFTVSGSGTVTDVRPTNLGSGYLEAPTITVSGGGGSGALLRAEIDAGAGQVVAVTIINPGSGYTSAPTLSFSAPPLGGTTAAGTAVVTYAVTSVAVATAGTGYSGTPQLTFVSTDGSGAFATCSTDPSDGHITGVTLNYGGEYGVLPTASIVTPERLLPRKPKLSPVMKPAIKGKYWCAYRYIDDTPESRDGPIPSSLSPLGDIELTDPSKGIVWTFTQPSYADSRATKIELWRSTADQALVLYKVATVTGVGTYDDTLGDNELIDSTRSGFAILPIVLPNGQVNAYRFTPPPETKAVVVTFQDRAWYAVDPAEPNSLYFSEVDEPESVPDTNELIIQTNVRGADSITSLMPFGAGMVVFQHRHAYRLAYAAQPVIDASVQLICQRGCLNQRCWDTYDGVAYVVDAMGMYVLDGSNAVPISDAVDTYWANGTINFASSAWFFVRIDPVTRIARFFFNESGTYPDRALCYHPVTKAWWLETYAQRFSSSECLLLGKRQRVVVGGESGGAVYLDSGDTDIKSDNTTEHVTCSFRTGNMPLTAAGASRSISVLYKPGVYAPEDPVEPRDTTLVLGLHYNNSAAARPSAVSTDRGSGFKTINGTDATLNMHQDRSVLGPATGYATASFSGRMDDKSAGGDRHLAVALSATRTNSDDIVLYGVAVDGVAQ